ncbi:MAG: class I SAM-dependent methyltransferase [Gemmatimonadota bacterium]
MRTSSTAKVRELYENTADSYAAMMDAEIDLPVYSDTLGRLAERIANIPGPVLDTSCGTGHMLGRYRERYDSSRLLVGIDLCPRMVAISGVNLNSGAETRTGDMRDLDGVSSNPWKECP